MLEDTFLYENQHQLKERITSIPMVIKKAPGTLAPINPTKVEKIVRGAGRIEPMASPSKNC